MVESRSKNAILNIKASIIGKMLTMIVAFFSRTFFIFKLGDAYLGVNGLYSEVLGLLSLAELGFGSAMTLFMYKPVADGDETKVVQLLQFYRKVYTVIAFVILGLGMCLLPIIPSVVRGADWLTTKELRIYYLIFLFNSFIGYFVSYKYAYINALQRNRITTCIDTLISIFTHVIQIIVLLCDCDFLIYLLINSFCLIVSRVFLAKYLNHKYPILKTNKVVSLPDDEKKSIFHEVRGLFVHQFAGIAVHGTDNILISMMTSAGIVTVGYISNYNMLMNAVLGFVTVIFSNLASGFGNIVASSSTERYYASFKEANFINFWIYGFCSIAFFVLVPPFIELWIGSDKLIDQTSFLLIVINCYLQGQSTIYNTARVAKGNFSKDKDLALLQAVVNLVVSICAAKSFGLVGIYIGTIVSRLVFVIFRPISTFSFLFDRPVCEYFTTFLKYFSCVVISGIITNLFTIQIIAHVSIMTFCIACMIVLIVPNLIFFLMFRKTEEFKKTYSRARSLLLKK